MSAQSVPDCRVAWSATARANVLAEEPVAEGEPEGDPARLAAGPAEMQAAGRRAEFPFQLPLPAVVRVAVHRVVGELRGRRVEQLEQHRAHRRRLVAGERAALDQLGEVGQVGQGQAAVQQRRVADLQRVTGLDELGRRATGDPGRGAEVSLGRTYSGHHASPPARPAVPGPGPSDRGPANSVGAPPLTRNT